MNQFKIRPLVGSDIPELIVLCQEHAEFESLAYDPTNKETRLKQLLSSSGCPIQISVVESGSGAIAGYCAYMIQYSTWQADRYVYMDCLYLGPDWRGQGIGKLLIDEILVYARNNGCSEIRWQTPVANESAVRFYDALPGSCRSTKHRYRLPGINELATIY